MSVEGKMLSRDISEIFWREEFSLATAESCMLFLEVQNSIKVESWLTRTRQNRICLG